MGRHKSTLVRLLKRVWTILTLRTRKGSGERMSPRSCEIVAGYRKEFHLLWAYLHSPDYSRAGLAKRLRALKG